ncbi:MAG TPA: DUF6125 family protein [Symbiobacteriaceae bacterium]|jgi:hypothetical protein
MREIQDLTKDELLELVTDFAKRWLAHDGLWFQAVEATHGLDEAIRFDMEAWERFTVVEAGRIRRLLQLPVEAGLDGLDQALRFRLYAVVNEQEILRPDERTLIFQMKRCRVQEARERKGMQPFPCKPVGLVEYAGFASAIDPRIRTQVLSCPPDPHPPEYHCAWRFTLETEGDQR